MAPGLRLLTSLPDAIAELPAASLGDALGGPTLFDLRQGGKPPLFVSTLLHGNETSGWDAVRSLARRGKLAGASWMLFIGNPGAAALGVRSLDGQPDFNRIWTDADGERDGNVVPGEAPTHADESRLADEVTDAVRAAAPFLAVDVHNNSGHNPPYSVVTSLDRRTLAAASAFAPRAIHARQPEGVQTRAFSRFCPALTIEVGVPEDADSAMRARAYLERCLEAGAPPDGDPDAVTLYENTVRVNVRGELELEPGLERRNFDLAPQGQCLARAGELEARHADGTVVTDAYLRRCGTGTFLARDVMLSMYTSDADIARQDCLCYFMTPLTS